MVAAVARTFDPEGSLAAVAGLGPARAARRSAI
jgi:hypothetical protein